MFNTTKRPYKDSTAKDTIEKIKNILKSLKLVPFESFRANPYPQIYSMRIELPVELGSFGTNGKGRTEEYSIASGYAEFLERMQNGLFAIFSRTMISEVKNKHGFYYNPDERFLSKEEFSEYPETIMKDIIRFAGESKTKFIESYYDRLAENKVPGAVAVPFYDTKNGELFYLPVNMLLLSVGSNGMAAGNTIAEAIFQAICELTERWGAAELFYKQLTPPTVPDEFLQQFEEEYGMMKRIEEDGKYEVSVLDFSAGKRIPSIGLLIQDKSAGKYKLNVGSDTSFQVALSRCLTEIFQGSENEEKFAKRLLDIPTELPEYFKKNDEKAQFRRYVEYGDFTKDGSGVFPPSLFGDTPSYEFDPTVFTTQESYEKEVEVLIKTFHEQGYNVYIRDVSFTGFPSVFVYIPEISGLGRKNAPITIKSEKFNIIELDKVEHLFFNFENLSKEDKLTLAKTMSVFDAKAKLMGLFNVKLKAGSEWDGVNVPFFLTLLWYHLGDLDKARKSFVHFLENRQDKEKNDYYKLVGEFLKLKLDGVGDEDMRTKLMELKGENVQEALVTEVIEDLKDPETVLRFIKLPICPQCGYCPIQSDCLTKNKLIIADNVYPMMKTGMPYQDTLAWVTG